MEKLIINSNNGKLNLPDLPQNCIFNKVITGCGGTTIALFNDKNYVIAVPTTELITNKTGLVSAGLSKITSPDGKEQSVFGLFGEFTYMVKKHLKMYLATEGIKKIMCTYDKVKYLDRYLKPADYQLLVDEYHLLLKAYSYRSNAIEGVLKHYKDYKSSCFMSATPISPEFKPAALEGLSELVAVWNDTDTLFVALERTNKPYVKASNIINAYKKDGYITVNGERSYEAFFFINSVTDIANILQYCHLSNDEVKIVCANTEPNREKLTGYTISNSRSINKPFTFITSKSFEGADYFSQTGICFVVSNSSNNNTLLDISTDIYQIAGRIRTEDNHFRNTLVHIVNTTGERSMCLDMDYEELVERTKKEVEAESKIIDLINENPTITNRFLDKDYVKVNDEGKYYLNEMLINLDLYTVKLEQYIYKNGISIMKNYNKNGIITTSPTYEKIEESLKRVVKKITFKEAFIKYCELKKLSLTDEHIIELYPLVVEAYNKLGEDKVRQLRYTVKAVEAELLNLDKTATNEYKVAKMLSNYKGFISCKDLKNKLKNIYSSVGINKSAKASDIETYYNCKRIHKRIDGVFTEGYELIHSKYIIK